MSTLLRTSAVGQHDDAVGQPDGLVDVMGHEDDGPTQPRPQLDHQILHAQAGLGVERGEGLVHEHHVGLAGEHPGKADALAHAAGELVGPLPRNVFGESDGGKQLA